MATGYATLYGDMAGGFAVIKDVPKTLVYALCRDLNARAGRDVIPQVVIEKPPRAELRPDQKDTRLAARRTTCSTRSSRATSRTTSRSPSSIARGFDRRARAARRAHGRPQRVQAPPGAARRARVAQGVRQGPAAADHQSLARLTPARMSVSTSTWETRRPLLPELALIAATIAYGVDVQDRAGRARRRHARRLHPAALRASARSCCCRSRCARGLAPARRRRADSARTFVARGRSRSASSASPATGSRTSGLQHTTDVELRVHHRPVRRVHAAHRDGRAAPASRRPTSSLAVVVAAVGLFLLTGAALSLELRRRAHARRARSASAIWIFVGGALVAPLRPGRAHRASRLVIVAVLAVPVVAVERARRRSPARWSSRWSSPACCCSAVAFTPPALGPALRRAEPRRGDPAVRAGRRRASSATRSASGSASPATSARS